MTEENDERIIEIENMFGLSGIPLRQVDRKLIGEGILMKMCRKKPKERHFFLFSDILVYGSIVVNGRKLVGQHIIEIEDVEIIDLQDDLSVPYFGFCVKSPKKSFAMYAVSTEEKEQWINHLKKCSEECSKKRGLVGLSAAKSPVWIPDAMAPKCMVCRLTVFTVLNRRHHCRHCGLVVCSTCSLKRWLLPYQSNLPVRVCELCYEQLKNGNEYISPSYPYVPVKNSGDDYISETSSEDSDYDENQSINLLNLTNPNISQILE